MLVHWIWLAHRTGVSDRMKWNLLQHFRDPEDIFFADREAYASVEGMTAEIKTALQEKDLTSAEKILEICHKEKLNVLTIQDAAYPSKLRNIPDPPVVLYYKGQLPAFPAAKPLYVFASHSHSDHFDPKVFQLAERYPQIHFILSHDIWMTRKKHTRAGVPEVCFEAAQYMRAHETKTFPCGEDTVLTVTTLRSTDMGVAFLVECDGFKIYHAGDLHWWLWPGDTKQAAGNMTANYQREIKCLGERLRERENASLDLAFLPLDPRLEANYALGMEYFLQNIAVKHVFPMHMWDDYKVITRYLERRNQTSSSGSNNLAFSSNIYRIIQEGQHWDLSQQK